MKKIQNDRSRYVTRSSLSQTKAQAQTKATQGKDRGDYKVDPAGYFIWPKKRDTAIR